MTTLTASFAGRTVLRVGYGALQLERLHAHRDEAVELLRRAVELGVDHVDTAEFYGFGFANAVIRETLRPEDGVLVVTKVGADPNPGGRFTPASGAAARAAARQRRGQPAQPRRRPAPGGQPPPPGHRPRAASRG